MLDQFKLGKTHMCLVIKVDSDTDRDPVRRIIGIVTLEDVIEEIINAEIIDETDRLRMFRHLFFQKCRFFMRCLGFNLCL